MASNHTTLLSGAEGPFSMALSQRLLIQLNDALAHRDVVRGFALLDEADKEWQKLSPSDPQATAFLVCLAQWVSLGYRDSSYVDRLLERFADISRKDLPFGNYVRLRFAEAQCAFMSDDMVSAIEIFKFVLDIEPGILEPELVIVSHYWKGRAHRRQNDFDAALYHILKAQKLAEEMNLPKFVAMTRIQESRLLFRRDNRKDAFRLLMEAEEELKNTGDALALGNIESARGRFVRRLGEYPKALEHFERAIRIYGERFPNRPNVARALVNAAYVKRLIALDLKGRHKSGRARAADHVQYLDLCREALELLERASAIYSQLKHQAGTGSVLVNAGYLHLDSGDIDEAEENASRAFELGQLKRDDNLLARARILQATIQNERAEEQLGDAGTLTTFAHTARSHAEEAILLAKRTENTRILAGAYVVRGFIAASDYFQEWETAKHFVTLAGALLGKDDLDHLSKQLALLKTRILRSTGVDETLRLWTEGITNEKSFQQITEEFAELVIPKVWEKQGRKIQGVAEVLSISPKKVRRILKSRGFLK
jgi:tetratricopeptide (TPR) repeat protein